MRGSGLGKRGCERVGLEIGEEKGCERVGLEGEMGCARVGGREGCERVGLEEEGVRG